MSVRSLLLGHAGIEMSSDAAFLGRVRRLRTLSIFALGLIWGLAASTLDVGWPIGAALLLGWALMPSVLGLSLRRPQVRSLVAVPSTLVGLALVAICVTALPTDPLARFGWLSLAAGVVWGSVLGAWFWYRWLPVPTALDTPYSKGRWTLVGVHVSLVVAGLGAVVLATFA